MRKLIASLLAIIMFLVTIPAVPVRADSDDEKGDSIFDILDAVNKSCNLVPDDRFDGEYRELENKDGTKTFILENGSVLPNTRMGLVRDSTTLVIIIILTRMITPRL